MNSIILVEDAYDIKEINDSKHDLESKIFTLNFISHELLEKENVLHEIGESYVSKEDKIKTFDTAITLRKWYQKHPNLKKLKFKGVNLVDLFDVNELHQFLLESLSKLIIIKRIIEKTKPDKIFVSEKLKHIIDSIPKISNFEVQIFSKSTKTVFFFDEYHINYKIGPIPISFNISRTNLAKIRKWYEKIATIQNFWYDEKKLKNTVLFLEFDPITYEELFFELNKLGITIILLNRRKSAIWNSKAISIIKKYNCKLVNENKLISNNKQEIFKNIEYFKKEFKQFWLDQEFLERTFVFENCFFWKVIKDSLIQVYENRLSDYVKLVFLSDELLKKSNFVSIVSLNSMGETENSLIQNNNNKIQTIILEHGYANFVNDVSRYDVFHMYYKLSSNDKIAVWGKIQKEYLQKNKNINENQFLQVGSPRHDSFFKIKKKININKKQILILTTPLQQHTGITDTYTVLRYQNLITNIMKILKQLDVEIIVKLHPSQDKFNKLTSTFFKKFDKNIPIFHATSILTHLKSSDAVIHIDPNGIGLSTSILESLILNIPTMNIIINDKIFEFDCVKKNAIMSFLDTDNLEKPISNLLFDHDIRNNLIINGKNHVDNYLINPGEASSKLAHYLDSFSH